MKALRNIITFAAITLLSSGAFAGEESSKSLLRLLGAYEAVSTYRPTLGVELEGIYPGKTRAEAFHDVEQIIVTKVAPLIHPGAKVTLEPYNFATARGEPRSGTKVIFTKANGEKAIWEVKDDGSIKPSKPNHIGVEVVSPILRSEKDVDGAEKLIEILAKSGFEAEPGSAALQVHAGFSLDGKKVRTVGTTEKAMTAQTLLLIWLFSKVEKSLIEHYRVHPDRAHFAKPTPQTLIDLIASGKFDLNKTNLNQLIESNYDYKYWALNVRALFRFGTYEVRFMNSTTDAAAINELIELSSAIAVAVKTKSPAMIELMTENLDSEITVRQLVDALKIRSIARSLDPVKLVIPSKSELKVSRRISRSCPAAIGN